MLFWKAAKVGKNLTESGKFSCREEFRGERGFTQRNKERKGLKD